VPEEFKQTVLALSLTTICILILKSALKATDIFDGELNGLRKKRWERAFAKEFGTGDDDGDLRATIVIEHIIQASDVSHTMQHWHIYRKWVSLTWMTR
jgi:hypothetical protein